ncbi:MAG: YebG family protein [Aeromonadaceae bacterium]
MAVEIKYVVVRNGEEKMTFVSKKEADAYDRMLDLADELAALLQRSPVTLAESQCEELALFLAREKDQLQTLLRGGKAEAEPARKRGNTPATETAGESDAA